MPLNQNDAKEEIDAVYNPNPFNRDLPYSSVRPQVKLKSPPNEAGTRMPVVDERMKSMPVMEAYRVSDHGFFKGRARDESVLEVDAIDWSQNGNVSMGTVSIYLTENPPMQDDVLPYCVILGMKAAGGDDAHLAAAYEEFWTHQMAKHRESLKAEAEAQAQAQATDMSAGDDLSVGTLTEDAKTVFTEDAVLDPIAEAPTEPPTHEATGVVTKEQAARQAEHHHRLALDTDPLSLALHRLYDRLPEQRPFQYGAVVTEAIVSKLMNEHDAATHMEALIHAEEGEGVRRISGLVIEEIRADRWKLKLHCREASSHGRATSSHTVHVTPGMFTADYRVTGGKKYAHQLEVVSYITACLNAVFTRLV